MRSAPHRRPQPIREAILAFLAEPRSPREVADHIGGSMRNARNHLAAMRRRGLVVQLGYAVYARADADGGCASPAPWLRPQPIRDAILAFLSEPRSARAIADHIGRSVPNATGHLAAMQRRSLAVRLSYAVYARIDPDGGRPTTPSPLDIIGARSPAMHAMLAFLDESATVRRIATHLGCPVSSAVDHLAALRRLGLVERVGHSVYCRVGSDLGSNQIADADAGAANARTAAEGSALAFLTGPRSSVAVACHLGIPPAAAARRLRQLCLRGLAARIGRGLYTRVADRAPAGSVDDVPQFLSRPRTLLAVADFLDCETMAAKRHLDAMVARGEVKRIGASTYARPAATAAPIARLSPGNGAAVRVGILAFVYEPRALYAIADRVGLSRRATYDQLRLLCGQGLVRRVRFATYTRPPRRPGFAPSRPPLRCLVGAPPRCTVRRPPGLFRRWRFSGAVRKPRR